MNNSRKKVLFFTSGAVGGAERVTLTIAKMLPETEYEVKIIHVCNKIRNIDKFVPNRFESKHIKIKNIWDFTTLRLYSLMRKEHPYAVFSSLNYLNIRVILAARLAHVSKIIMRNNIGWEKWDRVTRLLARISYPFATNVISQTKEMEDELMPVLNKQRSTWQVIPNPIDFDTINHSIKNCKNPYDTNKINFVYIGRIDKIKGLDTLLHAFKNVINQITNAYLTIVGDYNQNPEYYNFLKNMSIDLGIADNIKFVGFQANPYQYIHFASCLVLPSRKEGNPNILHEAMWLKIPVVATNSVPIVNRIVSAERGDVVNVDDIEQLGKAMLNQINRQIIKPYDYKGGQTEFINLFR